MANEHQNAKKDPEKKHVKHVKTFPKKRKRKGKKRSKKDIKIVLKSKSRNYVSI